MKKLFIMCLISGFISVMFGNYIFNIYKNKLDDTLEVISTNEKVYMLLYGSYNSKEKVDNLKISDYLLEVDDFYKVYIGITRTIENANIIKEIHKQLGNDIYIREKIINNLEFLDYLNYNDNYEKKSNEEILNIQKNIIKKYKELFNE